MSYTLHLLPCWAQAAVRLPLFPPSETSLLSLQAWLLLSADMWHSDLWLEAPNRTAGARKDFHFPLLLPSSSCSPITTAHCHARGALPSNQISHYPSYFIIFSMTQSFPPGANMQSTHLFIFTWCCCWGFFGPKKTALKPELGSEIRAQLTLASLLLEMEVGKCNLNTL